MEYKINVLELVGFRGLWLNRVKRFKMTTMSDIAVILGRNGCGKSSVMRIMSPLAPSKDEFNEGGYRLQEIESDKGRFQLKSIRQKSGMKHNIVNLDTDEVILDAANNTVYDETIKDLFGYTKEFHQLITGKVRLTSMSGAERKKWFSLLSESDLSFALNFYNRAKKLARDYSGGIEINKREISKYQVQILESEEEYVQVRKRLEEHLKERELIYDELVTSKADSRFTEETLKRAVSDLERMQSLIYAMDTEIPEDLLECDRNALVMEISASKALRDRNKQELANIIVKLEQAKKLNTISCNDIQQRINYLNERYAELGIEAYPALLDYITDIPLIDATLASIDIYRNALTDHVIELHGTWDYGNIGDSVAASDNELQERQKQINILQNRLAMIRERMEYIDQAGEVDCGKCGHRFKPGVGEDEHERMHEAEGKFEKTLLPLQTEQTNGIERHQRLIRIQRSLQEIAFIEQRYGQGPLTRILFNKLHEIGAFNGYGTQAPIWINYWVDEVTTLRQLAGLHQDIEKAKSDLAIVAAAQHDDYTGIEERQRVLEAELATLNRRISQIETTLTRLDTVDNMLALSQRYEADLAKCQQNYQTQLDGVTENIRVSLLLEHQAALRDLVEQTGNRLEEMDQIRRKLEYTKDGLRTLEQSYTATMQIVKAMSPEEGILSKHLYQCINKITELMTAFINAFWGYEIKILPCDISDGELDYKFPMWARDPENEVPDVSDGSTAQREVVDFVFMLTAYRALGLTKFPLFLDELGSGFDEGHREEMVRFIKGLLEQGQHSQVFMVSHNAETHFQLTQADMVVLDPTGITKPAVYNRFVEIV